MKNIDVRIVDVSTQLQSNPGDVPHAMLKREVAEGHLATPNLVPGSNQPYKILQGPLDGAHTWSTDKSGSHVAIPMRPYVFGVEAEMLVKFGLQFGALAASSGMNAERIVLLMSTVFARPDSLPGYCVYVGVAIRQEK